MCDANLEHAAAPACQLAVDRVDSVTKHVLLDGVKANQSAICNANTVLLGLGKALAHNVRDPSTLHIAITTSTILIGALLRCGRRIRQFQRSVRH